MILLHTMDSVQVEMVQGLLANQKGWALVLVHPIYFGWTKQERRATIENIVTHTPNAEADLAKYIRADQDGYLAGLRQAVNHRMFKPGVGFVFEEEKRLERVNYLHSLNSSFTWVVIPTLEKRAQPLHSTGRHDNIQEWQINLTKMQTLGLTHAALGGCYCIINSRGEPLRNEGARAGCVNAAYFKMVDSQLFSAVEIAGGATYPQDISSMPP